MVRVIPSPGTIYSAAPNTPLAEMMKPDVRKPDKPSIVYYSALTGVTEKFVHKFYELGHPVTRLPLTPVDAESVLYAGEFYYLVTPTYGNPRTGGYVPKSVIQFLNNGENRDDLMGVIGTGNTNFGKDFCRAASIIAEKCDVPVVRGVELMGYPGEAEEVSEIITADYTKRTLAFEDWTTLGYVSQDDL